MNLMWFFRDFRGESPSTLSLQNQEISNFMDKPRFLFLGIHNATGSQMAEAIMRKRAGDRYEIHSAGVIPKPIDPLTIWVMQEAGCDMSQAYSKAYRDLASHTSFSMVITVCKNIEDVYKFIPGSSMLVNWGLGEPIDSILTQDRLTQFRLLRDQVDQKIEELLTDLNAWG